MEEQFYKDIIEALKTKKTLNPREQKKNQEIENIRNKLKALFYVLEQELISENKSTTQKKEEIIKEIKKIIEEIDKVYHLKLDTIIQNEIINQEELKFAYELIYPNNETKEKMHKSQKLVETQKKIKQIGRKTKELEEKVSEILELLNQVSILNKKRNQRFIFNKKREMLNEKIEKIKTTLKKEFNKYKDLYGQKELLELLKMLNNNDFDSIEKEVLKIKELIINKIKSRIRELTKEEKKAKENGFTEEQIDGLTSIFSKKYTYALTHKSVVTHKKTKDIILILILINEIEKENPNRYDIIEQIEKENYNNIQIKRR